jgi:hypothetical protein
VRNISRWNPLLVTEKGRSTLICSCVRKAICYMDIECVIQTPNYTLYACRLFMSKTESSSENELLYLKRKEIRHAQEITFVKEQRHENSMVTKFKALLSCDLKRSMTWIFFSPRHHQKFVFLSASDVLGVLDRNCIKYENVQRSTHECRI